MSLFQNKYRIESARLNNWNYNSMGAYFITICTKNRTHFFGDIISYSSVSSVSSVETPCMASLHTISLNMASHNTISLNMASHNTIPVNMASQNTFSLNMASQNETPNNITFQNENPNILSQNEIPNNLSIETPSMASLQSKQQNQMILSKIGQIVQTEWLKTPQIRPDMNLSLDAFIIMPNHFHAILIIGENIYNKQSSYVETPSMASHNEIPDNIASHNETPNNLSTETPSMASLQSKPGPQRNNLSSIIRGFKSAVTMQARIINPDFEWQSRFHDHIIRDNQEFDRIKKYIINNPKSWDVDLFKN